MRFVAYLGVSLGLEELRLEIDKSHELCEIRKGNELVHELLRRAGIFAIGLRWRNIWTRILSQEKRFFIWNKLSHIYIKFRGLFWKLTNCYVFSIRDLKTDQSNRRLHWFFGAKLSKMLPMYFIKIYHQLFKDFY